MSLLLAGLIIAGTGGAVGIGRWLARRREVASARETVGDGGTGSDGGGAGDAATKGTTSKSARGGGANAPDERSPGNTHAPKARTKQVVTNDASAHLAGFPCQLGDVLMRVTGEEAWLAGGLVLSEEIPVSALFVAPESKRDCAIYARPGPREALFWLEPLDAGAVLVGGEPPSSVEHGGLRFDRVRRLPLRVKRIGTGAPDLGDTLILAEYASSGAERLLVARSASGESRAFRGVELEPSAYEVIASGRTTLGDD